MSSPVVYYMSTSEMYSAQNKYSSYLSQNLANTNSMSQSLNNFLSESGPVLTGQVWDIVRNDLHTYNDCLEYTAALNNLVDEANKEYFRQIQEFLQPDADLNTADLPKFEREKLQLENDISDLIAENEKLAETPETITVCYGYDEYGRLISETYHNPQYDIDQAQIRANNLKIETVLQPELNEKIRLINKINQFTGEVLPRLNAQLEEVEQKVNEYIKLVDEAKENLPRVEKLSSTSGYTYDLNTQEGRFLYIYDQLTQKYGYSEWGAKAILAQMHGTNSKFLADRFQSDLPTNAGYGLCQWEYKKYGGTVDDAQMMEDWCRANGLDHKTIDGQLAWLDHYLPIKGEHYHDPTFYPQLKTGGKEDYYAMVCKMGTYHQGTQGDQYKNYNRAYDGDLLYGLFPLIDQREAYKTIPATGSTGRLVNLGGVGQPEPTGIVNLPNVTVTQPQVTTPPTSYPSSGYVAPISYTPPSSSTPDYGTGDDTPVALASPVQKIVQSEDTSYSTSSGSTQSVFQPPKPTPKPVELSVKQEVAAPPSREYVETPRNNPIEVFKNMGDTATTSAANTPSTTPSVPNESFDFNFVPEPMPMDTKVVPTALAAPEKDKSKEIVNAAIGAIPVLGATTAAVAYTLNKRQKEKEESEEEKEEEEL